MHHDVDLAHLTQKTSFPKEQIKVLLLENIHPLAKDILSSEGFQIETLPGALSEDQLKERIRDVHVLGIRSKTYVSAAVLAEAKKLLTVGAFCIGTNQIELEAAKARGIPVFNAPFGNTRSVAEMIIAEVIMLSRQLAHRSMEMHGNVWKKISKDCHEVRGKTIGIIGYGHIGSQVSTLSEALGMRVLFFDILSKLPLGNAKPANSLANLLRESDFVTLHVPETPQTKGMISVDQIQLMKKGACLLNASRGTVVDIPALASALKNAHLSGAAIDVFPKEPENNINDYVTELQGLSNVILTPHIGGATEEAQANIGEEVPTTLVRYVNTGATSGAVNFPQVDLAPSHQTHRILNVHRNVPGVLTAVNRIVSDLGANISAQSLATDGDIGYLVIDTDQQLSLDIKNAIEGLNTSIKTRILY
ncbi:phosphoglycerate dehydrogenase [Bdellovibrionota bacterium FG-1]